MASAAARMRVALQALTIEGENVILRAEDFDTLMHAAQVNADNEAQVTQLISRLVSERDRANARFDEMARLCRRVLDILEKDKER